MRLDKKNLARRHFTQEARAAMFIKEYIQTKHEEIYQEAVAFYNYVNNIYPQKGDLRKTEEFKAMKLGFMFVAKQKNNVVKNNVVKNVRQVYLPITTTNQEKFTVIAVTTEQAETFPSTTEQAETFPSTTEQAETFPSTTEQAETFPSATEQAETFPSTTEQAETFPSTTEQADTVPGKDKPEKIMQLRIPLMSSHVMTETVKTVIQEVLEENPLTTVCNELLPADIQPTLEEEIPEEAYDQILAGLRQDPDLCKIMEEIEQDHDLNEILEEFVQDPDMDIDLPIEDDRLEQHLQDWEAW